MHGMKALSVAALVGLSSAWSYPDCEPDNCYRELTDSRFYQEAVDFCPGYLAGKTSKIPDDFENCGNDAGKVSSACSCITYSASTSTSSKVTSTSAPVTTTTSAPPVTTTTSSKVTSTSAPISSSTSCTEESTTTKAPTSKWTTSTVTETRTHTITSCKPEVTNCPGKPGKPWTTVETTVYTTVCPVTSTSTTTPWTTSTITETRTHTITSCKPEVTNCPGSPGKPWTTVETTVYTTVCPVTTPAGNGTWVPPVTLSTKSTIPGTVSPTKTKPTSTSVVTAGAARMGAEVAVAAVGVVAAMLL